MQTALIVDSHALIHRAYHAIPPLTTKSGIPTNALYGFLSLLQKAINDIKPTHIAACFDTPTESFRAKIVTEYQATRKPTDEALKSQFSLCKEAIDAANIARYEAPNYEADDAIGTVTIQLSTELNKSNVSYRIIIFTGDKDMFQLVNENVFVLTPQIGFGKSKLYAPSDVKEKMGVTPEYIADMKALMGDPSDNYKGLHKIGPKTATKLIEKYGHVEQMSENFDEETMTILRKMKEVSTIVTDVPCVNSHLADVSFEGFPADFSEVLKKYELYSLIPRFTKKENDKSEKVEKKIQKSQDQESLF